MDGGGSMQSNEERSAEKLMDDYLKSIGLHRKKIAKDGSCLFRAVAEQVLHCQSLHTEVRAKCVEFLKKNREVYEAFIEGDFEEYLYKLQDPQQWVGEVEINALAVIYKRDFLIYQDPGKPAVNITDNGFKDKVQLCFLNGNHYDSVYPVNHIKNAAVCQSILFELLYDGVFKVDRSCLGACQRIPRATDLLSDDNMNACASSDESDLDSGEPLWVENGTSTTTTRHSRGRGRGRYLSLSDRVRRSLNPTLFRNIEYDVWHKTKRAQQKMDYCIAAGMQFTAGDRCQVRIDGRNYNANIKEVPPNNGPVTVYVEELGRRQVTLWNLRPSNDENSWSTVVNRDKRISNGHGEWEERGRGRGRGKHLPASSSVSQATAPGSSGRVQKQHSWPPQANTEEQGGAKANRKSVSSVEAAFGLTEEQRLAKEEEERNVALVEIQLRDEHSFPALGTQPGPQGDGGRKKGGEKKKSQRNKTKSPVEDIRAPSPSAGERPKSTTPPLRATSAAAAPSTDTTTPSNPTPPAAKPPAAPSANSDSSPACLSSIKASSPDVNVATTAAAQAAASIPTSTCAAPPAKTNAPSYVLAARAPSSSPPAAPSANSDSSPAWMSSLKAPSPDVNMDATVATAAASVSTSTSAAPTAKTNAPPNALASSSPPAAVSSTKPPVTGVAVPPSVPSSASLISHLPPALPAASSPPTPHTLSSSSPPPSSTSTASPPPSSSLPPPTFIAPIAPSPAAAQGFIPRSTPPLASLHHSPSPPPSSSVQNSSSSSVMHHVAPTHEAPPVSAQTPSIGGTLTAPQTFHSPVSLSHIHPQVSQSHVSVSQTQNLDQTQTSLPSNQIVIPQMQTEAQSSVPQSAVSQPSVPQPSVSQSCSLHLQHQPQSHTEVTSLPQTQIHPSVPHVQPQSQSQSEVVQVPHTSQASLPVSVQPHPHLHVHPAQPPHPSQLPHPALPLSTSSTHPSLQPQTSDTQNPTEAPPLPPLHTQPNSQPQQSHPHHPSHHPPPIPGAVPLQQLSQLYQDPLYPGFPQGEKGDVVPPPLMSSNKSGDDLPQDVNILRFFFNLGVKAYTNPYFPPYLYLLPLQQAHTMHPKLPSRSPSPTPTPTPPYPPFNPPTRHQEAYPHPQYPPTSASLPPQFDHQAPLTEPPHPSDPSFNQAGYPITQPPPHRVSWQDTQIPPPRNPSFPVRYPTPSPAFPVPPQLSQGYHPGQGPGHQLYPPSGSPYPPTSLGYPSLPAHEEHQVSQGVMEQRQPTNGDMMRGQGPSRVPGPAGAAANLANANNNRTMVASGFSYKKEQGDSLSGTVLLLDPPLNNKPIHVPNPAMKDVPVSMTTMKTSSIPTFDIISKMTVPGDSNHHSSRGYRGHQKPLYPTNTYVPLGAPEPSQVGFLANVAMDAPLSVGCNTEDDWDEQMGYKPPTSNYRGQRRNRGGGGRGRGGHEPGRGGPRRRHGGEPGVGFGQYSTFHRGRGRERGGY